MAFWGKNDDDKKKESAPTTVSSVGSVSGPASQTKPVVKDLPQLFNPTAKSLNTEEPKVRSALGPGTVIQGKLSFDATVSIDGKLTGEIFSSKTLIVGTSGVVDATIEVAELIVRGVVKGSIKASERIEIKDGGQLIGDIITPALVMQDGCLFSGNCSMVQANKKVLEVKKAG